MFSCVYDDGHMYTQPGPRLNICCLFTVISLCRCGRDTAETYEEEKYISVIFVL